MRAGVGRIQELRFAAFSKSELVLLTFFPAQRLRKPTLASKSVNSSLNMPGSPAPASSGLGWTSFRSACSKGTGGIQVLTTCTGLLDPGGSAKASRLDSGPTKPLCASSGTSGGSRATGEYPAAGLVVRKVGPQPRILTLSLVRGLAREPEMLAGFRSVGRQFPPLLTQLSWPS